MPPSPVGTSPASGLTGRPVGARRASACAALVGAAACTAGAPAAGQGILRGALVEATPGLPPFPSGRRWRLSDAVGTPPWLRWVIEHRARVEHLGPDYRVGAHTATALMLRTSVAAELRWRDLVVGAELLDARAPFASEHTPLSNGSVNPLDVLEGYVGLVRRGALVRGDTLAVTVGRFTLNVGNRRLVARNEFRNTVNAARMNTLGTLQRGAKLGMTRDWAESFFRRAEREVDPAGGEGGGDA